jgi:hypothetical protein
LALGDALPFGTARTPRYWEMARLALGLGLGSHGVNIEFVVLDFLFFCFFAAIEGARAFNRSLDFGP